MSKRFIAAAIVLAAACCSAAWAVATLPGNPASFTDITTPGTSHTTTLPPEPDGSVRAVTTIDGNLAGVVTGPYHTTILRVTHPGAPADTSGVDWCYACTDLNENTGQIGNHLIGVTGSPTHTDLGSGTDGLVNDRGTFTLVRNPGQPLTDVGFFSTAPPCLAGKHAGPLLVPSGVSICLAPGAKVSGGVTVQPNGELFANGATISGGLRADSPAAISVCGTRISGPVSVSGAQLPVLFGEPYAVDATYAVRCPGNTISGPVALTGNVGGTDFSGNTVSGPVTATGNTGGFVFGDFSPNTIAGPVATSGNV